jgi:hypothetical protein
VEIVDVMKNKIISTFKSRGPMVSAFLIIRHETFKICITLYETYSFEKERGTFQENIE